MSRIPATKGDTQNPYTRPEVKGALLALKETRGFAGAWMDVLKDF